MSLPLESYLRGTSEEALTSFSLIETVASTTTTSKTDSSSNTTDLYKGCVIGAALIRQQNIAHVIKKPCNFTMLLGCSSSQGTNMTDTDTSIERRWEWRGRGNMPFSVIVTTPTCQCSYISVSTYKHLFGEIHSNSNMDPPEETLKNSIQENTNAIGADKYHDLTCASNETCLPSYTPCCRGHLYQSNESGHMSTESTSNSNSNSNSFSIINTGRSDTDDAGECNCSLYNERGEGGRAEMLRFTDGSFTELRLLGRGAYGSVTYARGNSSGHSSRNSSKYYALKRIHKANARSTQHIRHICDECQLLLLVQPGPFIVRCLGLFSTPHDIVLVLEPSLHGDLWGVIYEEEKHRRGLPVELIQVSYERTLTLF